MNLAAKMWYVQYVRWKKKKKIEVIVKNKKQNKKKQKKRKPVMHRHGFLMFSDGKSHQYFLVLLHLLLFLDWLCSV